MDLAEAALREVTAAPGASAEAFGALGRLLKARWRESVRSEDEAAAERHHRAALEVFLHGFELHRRDPVLGLNALALIELGAPPARQHAELLRDTRRALMVRLAEPTADSFDHATALDLAVLANDPEEASRALVHVVAHVTDPAALEVLVANLASFRDARAKRGEHRDWADELELTLRAHARSLASTAE